MSHLYRKSFGYATAPLLAIFLVFTLAAQAQRPEMRRPQNDDTPPPSAPAKKSKRMPRAIAVLEMLPGGGARLVPVALWMDGKYYDASLYGANPEPFVLQPGTVYEAQNYGETAGTFVVKMPKLVGSNWIGDGQWKPYGALDAKIAADKAKHPAPKPKDNKAIFTGGPDEGPPVLHRAGASDSTQKTDTTASSPAPVTGQTTTQGTSGQGQGSAPGNGGSAAGGSGAGTNGSGAGTNGSAASTSGNGAGTSGNGAGTTTSSSKPTLAGDSGRPTLKRPSDGDDSASSANTSSTSSTDDGSVTVSDPNRPTMHRAPAADSGSSASADDPDRPVIHRSAPAAATQQASTPTISPASSPSSDDNDPDRPVLSHGNKPAGASANTASASTVTATSATKAASPSAVAAKSATPSPGTPVRFYPAISDAGTYTNRSFLYPMTPEDKQQKAPALLAMAMAQMRAFASERPGPQIPKTASLNDYDLRAFDLDFSNTPTLVLTAKLPVASTGSKPFVYYTTVVARLDINGDPQKVFSSVTDTTHLDAYARMELVDALDADANGRGDLLFRQYSDVGVSYGLYRVFPYNMEKVFEGGSSL